jgi:hypothetical protein
MAFADLEESIRVSPATQRMRSRTQIFIQSAGTKPFEKRRPHEWFRNLRQSDGLILSDTDRAAPADHEPCS